MRTVFRHQTADRNEVDIRRVTFGASDIKSACRINSLVREYCNVVCILSVNGANQLCTKLWYSNYFTVSRLQPNIRSIQTSLYADMLPLRQTHRFRCHNEKYPYLYKPMKQQLSRSWSPTLSKISSIYIMLPNDPMVSHFLSPASASLSIHLLLARFHGSSQQCRSKGRSFKFLVM